MFQLSFQFIKYLIQNAFLSYLQLKLTITFSKNLALFIVVQGKRTFTCSMRYLLGCHVSGFSTTSWKTRNATGMVVKREHIRMTYTSFLRRICRLANFCRDTLNSDSFVLKDFSEGNRHVEPGCSYRYLILCPYQQFAFCAIK